MFIWSYYDLVKDVTHNVKDEHWQKSKLSDTDSTGSGLLIWNPGHHKVKYFPLFNHTQYPWLLCIFSFKCFLSLLLDCSTNNQGIRKLLKWRAARKLCWKACGVNPGTGILLALRFEGMAMEDFKPQAKPCQFCTVFCKQVEVTPSSGKRCQVVKIQVERQRVAVGFSRAAFMGELKCVDEEHLAWLVVSLGTVKNINGCSGHFQSQHWNLHEV